MMPAEKTKKNTSPFSYPNLGPTKYKRQTASLLSCPMTTALRFVRKTKNQEQNKSNFHTYNKVAIFPSSKKYAKISKNLVTAQQFA
jgi:hypothetical protein